MRRQSLVANALRTELICHFCRLPKEGTGKLRIVNRKLVCVRCENKTEIIKTKITPEDLEYRKQLKKHRGL